MISDISDRTPPGIIRLEPVFKEMIWGGNRMREEFGYDIPGDDTGECWAIAAHKHGDCRIAGGEYEGKTLSWLWKNRPGLFGRPQDKPVEDEFPMLVKIIDAGKDLSIQVHPDDEYARTHENGAKGKAECWHVLDCGPDATIIIGHNAKDREELENMVRNNRWNELLREVPIHKGDVFRILPGTIHAIKAGTMILETQENSDITYRLYDYGRLQNGRPRELHIEKSLDVIRVPFDAEDGITGNDDGTTVDCDFFSVRHYRCREGVRYYGINGGFMLCSVIGGEGSIIVTGAGTDLLTRTGTDQIHKGDHFIIPAGFESFSTTGNIEMICSMPKEM